MWLVDLGSGFVDRVAVSADRRPSAEELASENAELRALVQDSQAMLETSGMSEGRTVTRSGELPPGSPTALLSTFNLPPNTRLPGHR